MKDVLYLFAWIGLDWIIVIYDLANDFMMQDMVLVYDLIGQESFDLLV